MTPLNLKVNTVSTCETRGRHGFHREIRGHFWAFTGFTVKPVDTPFFLEKSLHISVGVAPPLDLKTRFP